MKNLFIATLILSSVSAFASVKGTQLFDNQGTLIGTVNCIGADAQENNAILAGTVKNKAIKEITASGNGLTITFEEISDNTTVSHSVALERGTGCKLTSEI